VRKLTEWGERLSEGKFGRFDAAIAFVAVYFLCQTIIQPLVSYFAGTGVSIDDAEQLIYLPHLWAGYGGSQPPLFTWINWTATHLFGVSILTLKVVKYLVLFLAFVSVHRAMRLLGYERHTTATASLGLLTVPQIVWEMQHALTHSVASLAFSALAFWALAQLLIRRNTISYVFFGAAAALAILAKFNDVIFIAAMLGAALSIRSYRTAILDKRIVLSLVVLVLALTPTTLWSLDHFDALFARMHKFRLDPSGNSFLFTRLKGLVEFGIATFDFVIMTLLVCGLAFAAQKLDLGKRMVEVEASDRFLARVLLTGYALTAILVLTSGTTAVRDRWLLPLLFLLPAYIAVRAERAGTAGRKVQYLIAALAAAIAITVMPVSWYMQAWGGNGKSHTARLDYAVILKDMEADGPVNTIVSDTSWIGNFRLVEQNLVLLNQEVPGFKRLIRMPAVLVWLGGEAPSGLIVEKLRQAGYQPAPDIKAISAPDRLDFKKNHKISFTRLEKLSH
jgi:4-amino-4-deoxy-L-arabinose transferase-like glycosyltransferase